MQHLAMVVEDDQALRFIYQRILSHAGFEVLEAPDGAQAVELLKENAPDIVFLDILLPGVNGQAVLNYLKNAPHLSKTQVVIVSSNRRFEQLLESATQGQFFLKPIRPAEIRSLLAQVAETNV
jgi:CheY-like chemotaxis protein